MPRRDLAQAGNLGLAALDGNGTAVVKPAARRRIARIGNIALNREGSPRLVHPRYRRCRNEGLRVGMLRRPDHALGRAVLDESCEVHDHCPLRDIAHQRQVVRDIDGRESQARLDLTHKVQDASPHADVEHGDRLVGDDEPGSEDERARQHDSLQLAAGQLVREFLQDAADVPQAYAIEHSSDAIPMLGSRHARVDQRFRQDAPDCETRIEGIERVLEDELCGAAEGFEGVAL